MLQFKLTILGCGSASPSANRNSSAQILTYNTNHYMIDCAEGTQKAVREKQISLLKINNIFISHLHGDHFYGIFGLISTLSMLGRQHELNIFAPKDLKEMYEKILNLNEELLGYKINFVPLQKNEKQLILNDKFLNVYSFPLKHSVDVWGFLFSEKEKALNIKKESIQKYNLSIQDIVKIKNGENFIDEKGNIIDNQTLTLKPEKARIYAYCTDTIPIINATKYYENANLLYHESTYCEDKKKNAKLHLHSTAKDAAKMAKLANVKKLILGHYSSSYKNEEQFVNEAKEIFENTVAAYDGLTIIIN